MHPGVYEEYETRIHPIVTKQMYRGGRHTTPLYQEENNTKTQSNSMVAVSSSATGRNQQRLYQHSMQPHSSKRPSNIPTAAPTSATVSKKSSKTTNRKRKNPNASTASHVTKRHPHTLGLTKKRPSDVGSIGPFRDASMRRPSLASPLLERSAESVSPSDGGNGIVRYFSATNLQRTGGTTGKDTFSIVGNRHSPLSPVSMGNTGSVLEDDFVDENRHPYDEDNVDSFYQHTYADDDQSYDDYNEEYFQQTPRETLEERKKRESQALRQMNQDLLQKKKRQQLREQEQRRQQILHEKRSKPSGKRPLSSNTSRHFHPVEFIPSKSQLRDDQISPRARPSSQGVTQVTSRIAAHMQNIRRKSLQRKSMDGTDGPMLARTYSAASTSTNSRPISSRYLHSAMLDQHSQVDEERETLYSETPEEYELLHQDSASPISGRVHSRPISAKLNYMRVGSAGQSRKSERTYSAYPAPVRHGPEVYRQEKQEVQLMKQIRHLHSAENNSRKAFSVRLGKIRGKEAKIKFEHQRESYFKEVRKEKVSVRESLLEKQQKMEEEAQRVRERIKMQKKKKQQWKKQREFFVQFSCRHNMISKQLTSTTIKTKQDEHQTQLQEVVSNRKKEMEERKEHLQNVMFRELNRKRAMVTFGNHVTKQELGRVAQEKRRKKRQKAKEVREWERSKKFTNSEIYADYSIASKKRHHNTTRRQGPQVSARDHGGDSARANQVQHEDAQSGGGDEALMKALNLGRDSKTLSPTSSIVSPRSSRPSSAVVKRRSRPKSAAPSSARYTSRKPRLGLVMGGAAAAAASDNDDDFEFDAQRDPQRPSSAHAPLKMTEHDV
uniref:Uncharacterized protein n=1 Tax=Percolomonas cosmopolitus TaxID=63605 RepID=A0A7S1KQ70_9EUKA